jgi:ABC-type transporter Mla subunit MlaD
LTTVLVVVVVVVVVIAVVFLSLRLSPLGGERGRIAAVVAVVLLRATALTPKLHL